MKKQILFLLTTALTLLSVVAADAQSTATLPADNERLNRIDAVIQNSLEKQEFAGATGLILQNGKMVYHKAFGFANLAERKKLEPDAIFRIASQTKAITSVAVMMLFEEGKFLLDDPISKFIPEFKNPVVLDQFNPADTSYTTKPAKREITIRDLLTHTSGIKYSVINTDELGAIYAKAAIPCGISATTLSTAEVIKRLARCPLAHDPGAKFTYGLNTDVLGYLVEVVSGKPLDQFFKERIFTPLGMKDTYFDLPADKQKRLVAVHKQEPGKGLFVADHNGLVITDFPLHKVSFLSGGAGLSSTVQDYGVFLQMLLNGGIYNGKRLLARRTVELMTSNQIGEISIGQNKFGLGFELISEAEQAILGQTKGSFQWAGHYGTLYWADPAEKIVALFFINQFNLKSDMPTRFRALVYQALTH